MFHPVFTVFNHPPEIETELRSDRNCILALQRFQDQANDDDDYEYDYEYEDDDDEEDEESDGDGEYNIDFYHDFPDFPQSLSKMNTSMKFCL